MLTCNRDEIRNTDLMDLFTNDKLAIRVRHYFPDDVANAMSDALVGSSLHGKYANAADIGRVGQAFYECQADPAAAERYERDAVNWIRQLRQGLSPQLTPIDRVRLELDEIWGAGAQVATINGRKMFVGLARTFGEGTCAEPHQDVFRWDAPHNVDVERVTTQIAMNVYLKMPERGGELAIWKKSYSFEEYEQRRNPASYGLRREDLADPDVVVQPEVGELILFNSTNVHAVEEIKTGLRVTWSCFIGFQGTDKPLLLWS